MERRENVGVLRVAGSLLVGLPLAYWAVLLVRGAYGPAAGASTGHGGAGFAAVIVLLCSTIAGVLLAHAVAWLVDLSGTVTWIVRYQLSAAVVAFVLVVYAAVINPDTVAQFLQLLGLILSAAVLGSAATLWNEAWLALYRWITGNWSGTRPTDDRST